LAGAVLRLFNLTREGFWVDEGYSARIAQLSITHLYHALLLDTHPPVYFFILHLWYLMFGNSEFSFRLLSVFFGVLSILTSYLLGKKLFNKTAGYIAALCIALNTFLIAFSQEARMYSLLSLLSLTSFYFFILSMKYSAKRHWIIYFLSSLLLLYTHIHGIFIIGAQTVYVFTILFLDRKNNLLTFRSAIIMQALLGLLYLPWIVVVKYQLIGRMESWIPVPSFLSIGNTFLEFSGSIPLMIWFAILILIALLGTIPELKTSFLKGSIISDTGGAAHKNKVHSTVILLIWLCTTIFLPFLISVFLFSLFKSKYVIAAVFPFILLSINGLITLRNTWIKVSCILIYVGLSLLSIQTYFSTLHKDQWREAVHCIETQAYAGDLLLFNAGYNLENIFNYYSRRTDLFKIPFPAKSVRVNCPIDEKNIHELDTLIGRFKHIWIIASQNKDDKALLAQKLAERYDFVGKKRFIGVGIYRFDLRKR
jgi:uncharacterized membrane protein